MDNFTFSVKNIADGQGVGISITGMLIVFVALTVLAIFITILPHVLRKLEPYLPTVDEMHALPDREAPAANEQLAVAIGYALFKQQTSGKKT
jgi:Na+-transporting methylmalonyl-CoA/oxaloacetate decarboxylase gamma subunit